MSRHSTLASCVAATALLAASSSGAKQGGGSSDAASAYEQEPYGDEEYSDEAVRRVTKAFERLGLSEDRLSVVYENATELEAPHIMLRLAERSS